LLFFFLVVDEFDKNQGMKSNSYTQQHLKHDQNHVPHNTFPWTRQERQERWFFIKLGVSIILEKLMMFHALGDFIILEKLMMLHEFGDFIILEKANNLNTCC
jgi:hypothetical protein